MKKKCYSMRTMYTTTRGEATLSTILVSRQFSRIAMIQLDFFLAPLVLSGTNHHTSCMTSIYEFCSWHPFLPRHWYSKCKMSRPIYNILDAEYYRISTTWLLGNQKCTELSWHFAFAMLPYFMWMIRCRHLCYSWETIWELIDIDLHDMTRKMASEFALEWSA